MITSIEELVLGFIAEKCTMCYIGKEFFFSQNEKS